MLSDFHVPSSMMNKLVEQDNIVHNEIFLPKEVLRSLVSAAANFCWSFMNESAMYERDI